jgi:arsenite-transporting ATPase
LVGIDSLRQFADDLYGDLDAAAVLYLDDPLRVEAVGEDYVLRLALPFADRDDLELGRHDDELQVRVGPYRRSLVLPDSLRRREVVAATLDGSHLDVTFRADTGPIPAAALEFAKGGRRG